MEPTSATILGLLVHRRWPTPAELLGMALLLIGVVIAIGVFARAPTAPPDPAAPSTVGAG
jgi:drug/metabolite transporter (DMT)-like permease